VNIDQVVENDSFSQETRAPESPDLPHWDLVRDDFPITGRIAYLNSAAAGPVSRSVQKAAAGFYQSMMEDGDAEWDHWLAWREETRARIAKFINAEPDEVAFTTNTSSGMNVIVDALQGHGEVISSELEFPVTTITWMHRGIPVHLLSAAAGGISPADIERAMTAETRVISISHVQYSNGFRADLEGIGRIKDRHKLVVNASQSAGAFQIDVKRMRIDALCATGHKWMLAGYGSGFVYMSRELLREAKPRAIGWMSVEDPYAMVNDRIEPRNDTAARVEWGCPHFAGIFALGASVDGFLEIGAEMVEHRVLELNRRLTSGLAEAGWKILSPLENESSRSGETLVATENPKRVVAHLTARDIAVTEKPQGIRVATHIFNNEDDIERLMIGLEETRR
jgi:cysteine desulfurase/selenocysteine lyase